MALLALLSSAQGLVAPRCRPVRMLDTSRIYIPPADASLIQIEADAEAVGKAVLAKVELAAAKAISERGHFALAIPGGSVLKMLKDSKPAWANRATLAYVNHKAVAVDDAELSTHAKASKLFLSGWKGCDTIVMDGTADAVAEAEAYEAKLQALPENRLPRTAGGLPCFDMMLVGVGDDGHVGSLYPGRDEVLATQAWVLPVEMKTPGSISLSLPVMAAAKQVVIAACGVSEKYPQGKSDAMRRAIEGEESLVSFPASGLRPVATWVLDEAAVSKLSAKPRFAGKLRRTASECVRLVGPVRPPGYCASSGARVRLARDADS